MGKIDEIKDEILEEKEEIESRVEGAKEKYDNPVTRKAVLICSIVSFIAGIIIGAKYF